MAVINFPIDMRTPEEQLREELEDEHEDEHDFFVRECPACQREKARIEEELGYK